MWKKKAETLFFTEHLRIKDIAEAVGKARETVSRHIRSCVGYNSEISARRINAAEKRREYKREWNAVKRFDTAAHMPESPFFAVTDETVRAEHALAAYLLSREKY